MSVLVDTSVWSLALRRSASPVTKIASDLEVLVREGEAVMIGPIRQELLSGIKERQQVLSLREHLRAFPDLPIGAIDYEEAAEFFDRCRTRGIQGSNTDFLICAVAARRRLPIFTADKDFTAYARILPLRLHRQPN